MLPKYIEKNYKFNNFRDALKKAEDLGCTGTHTEDGQFYPCKNADALFSAAYSVQYDTLVPSTFETIDRALFRYVDEDIGPLSPQTMAGQKYQLFCLLRRERSKLKTTESCANLAQNL